MTASNDATTTSKAEDDSHKPTDSPVILSLPSGTIQQHFHTTSEPVAAEHVAAEPAAVESAAIHPAAVESIAYQMAHQRTEHLSQARLSKTNKRMMMIMMDRQRQPLRQASTTKLGHNVARAIRRDRVEGEQVLPSSEA